MSIITYYIIKTHAAGGYLGGTPKDWESWYSINNARKFRAISEIRSFMTRMLKYPSDINVQDWTIEKHDIAEPYPVTDIFTSSHTMALLKHQNTV
jgi:hypothetical protein